MIIDPIGGSGFASIVGALRKTSTAALQRIGQGRSAGDGSAGSEADDPTLRADLAAQRSRRTQATGPFGPAQQAAENATTSRRANTAQTATQTPRDSAGPSQQASGPQSQSEPLSGALENRRFAKVTFTAQRLAQEAVPDTAPSRVQSSRSAYEFVTSALQRARDGGASSVFSGASAPSAERGQGQTIDGDPAVTIIEPNRQGSFARRSSPLSGREGGGVPDPAVAGGVNGIIRGGGRGGFAVSAQTVDLTV